MQTLKMDGSWFESRGEAALAAQAAGYKHFEWQGESCCTTCFSASHVSKSACTVGETSKERFQRTGRP